MQAGHHEQHPEEGPGQARGEGGSGSGVMLRVTLMLAKILEFSELFRGTAMCIAIAHARMVQYAKQSHCTCQPNGPTPKEEALLLQRTNVHLCARTRIYLYDCTRVPATCNL